MQAVAFVGNLVIAALAVPAEAVDPRSTIHVLWPEGLPRLSPVTYASWFKANPSVDWIGEKDLPQESPDATVELFYLTKPVFGIIGDATGIWHHALGFRVAGGPSYMFEYTSLDFLAAVAFPRKDRYTTSVWGLHWPTSTMLDYHVDPSGETFPVAGAAWAQVLPIGNTTGAALNDFFRWSLRYRESHPRYLAWRVLDAYSERPLVEAQECADFVFRGLRHLAGTGQATLNVTHLTRTVVNVYASSIDFVPANQSVADFFYWEVERLGEWLELTGEVPILVHNGNWIWPANYDVAPYAGGNSSLKQDADQPLTYHRYHLSWPRNSESASTRIGVNRVPMPIFPDERPTPAAV